MEVLDLQEREYVNRLLLGYRMLSKSHRECVSTNFVYSPHTIAHSLSA